MPNDGGAIQFSTGTPKSIKMSTFVFSSSSSFSFFSFFPRCQWSLSPTNWWENVYYFYCIFFSCSRSPLCIAYRFFFSSFPLILCEVHSIALIYWTKQLIDIAKVGIVIVGGILTNSTLSNTYAYNWTTIQMKMYSSTLYDELKSLTHASSRILMFHFLARFFFSSFFFIPISDSYTHTHTQMDNDEYSC